MPAVSVAQRKYFGWLEHAPDAAGARKKSGMSHDQMHDFAATKDAGLPARVPHKADGSPPMTNTTFQQSEQAGKKPADWMERARKPMPHLADGKWAEKAFAGNKGGLHRATRTPAGKSIPVYRVKKAAASGDSHVKHMAQAAENINPGRYKK